MYQHHEGVPLAGGILLPLQVAVDQLRGVRDQRVKVPAGVSGMGYTGSSRFTITQLLLCNAEDELKH